MELPKNSFSVHSCFRDGAQPAWIEVEVHARVQIPGLQILGLPAPEIRESKERILAAFPASGFEFPRKKVTINLAPSSVPKWGTSHDLSIALRILTLVESVRPGPPVLASGELGLDGGIKSTGSPALLMELLLSHSHPGGYRLILAEDDHREFLNLLRWRRLKDLPLPENVTVFRISHFSKIRQVLSEGEGPSHLIESGPTFPRVPTHPSLLPPGPRLARILTLSSIIKHVMSSTSEAEMAALYNGCKVASPLRTTLEEMGHYHLTIGYQRS